MLSCPCLNVQVQVEDTDAEDASLVATWKRAEPGVNVIIKRCSLLKITLEALAQETADGLVRCLNCSNVILAKQHDGDLVAYNSQTMLSEKGIDEATRSPLYSATFGIIVYPSTVSTPPLPPPTVKDPKLQHITFLANKETFAYKKRVDAQIAQLRKDLVDFIQKTHREAECLFVKAGYQRGQFDHLENVESDAADRTREPRSAPRSESLSFKRRNSSADAHKPEDLDLATSLRLSTIALLPPRPTQLASSSHAAQTGSDKPAEVLAPDSATSPSTKRVKFVEPVDETTRGEESSVDTHEQHDREEVGVFQFDEETEEAAASDTDAPIATDEAVLSEITGLDIASVGRSSATLESTSPGRSIMSPGHGDDRALVSSPLSPENQLQIRKLRDLLGSDAPSHRDQSLHTASETDGQTDLGTEMSDDPEDVISPLARSLPIGMTSQFSKGMRAGYENKTSLPQGENSMVPPLPQRESDKLKAQEERINQELRRATEDAALIAKSLGTSFKGPSTNKANHSASSSESGIATPTENQSSNALPVAVPSNYFSPTSIRPAFGPSSLSAALSGAHPLPTSQPSANDTQLDGVPATPHSLDISGASDVSRHVQHDDLDFDPEHSFNHFVPPHLWVRMSKGGEGLLSTSVRDLNL